MTYTQKLIEKIKAEIGKDSDYAVSQALNIGGQYMTRYKNGSQFSEPNAIKAAEILGLNPRLIVAKIGFETARTPEEKAYYQDCIDHENFLDNYSIEDIEKIAQKAKAGKNITKKDANLLGNFAAMWRGLFVLGAVAVFAYTPLSSTSYENAEFADSLYYVKFGIVFILMWVAATYSGDKQKLAA